MQCFEMLLRCGVIHGFILITPIDLSRLADQFAVGSKDIAPHHEVCIGGSDVEARKSAEAPDSLGQRRKG